MFGFQEVRLEVANPSQARSHKKRRRSKTFASSVTQSQISDLADGLPGYHFVYQPAMLYMEKFQERKEEGLAVFSRYPIIASNYKLLFKSVYSRSLSQCVLAVSPVTFKGMILMPMTLTRGSVCTSSFSFLN